MKIRQSDTITPFRINEGVYSFPKSNSQVYNFAYKRHFTILDRGQNFEGSFQENWGMADSGDSLLNAWPPIDAGIATCYGFSGQHCAMPPPFTFMSHSGFIYLEPGQYILSWFNFYISHRQAWCKCYFTFKSHHILWWWTLVKGDIQRLATIHSCRPGIIQPLSYTVKGYWPLIMLFSIPFQQYMSGLAASFPLHSITCCLQNFLSLHDTSHSVAVSELLL